MSKKGVVKLSEEKLIQKITKREKIECYLKVLGGDALIIGLVGAIIFKLVGTEVLMTLFLFLCCSGLIAVFLGVVQEAKTRSLVNEQMGDFYEAELQKAFGPRLRTSEMSINSQLIEKLRPIDENWDACDVWRFYEGNYHGTHFSTANVELYVVQRDQDGETRNKKFEGVVLRCKDICAPALDIFLRGSKLDHHQCDLMEPAVFRQYFSARTADDQPADNLVNPQLRELIQKLESLGNKYNVSRLLFRDGEAILVINGYTFAVDLPEDRSLRNLDEIRSRFKNSLTPMSNMIDVLRDSGGKL